MEDKGAWLEKEDVLLVRSGCCPDCGGRLLEGPHGGLSINVKCGKCGSKFNVCGEIGVERI